MPNTELSKPIWLALAPLLSFGIFILDRLTKVYFVVRPEERFVIVPNWLWLQLHLNDQMALSLPLFPLFYYSFTAVVLVVLMAQLVKAFHQRKLLPYTLILLIVAGALSNLLDRFYYGGVIDFISIRLGSVFNIADTVIVLAIGIWIVHMFWHDRHKKISKTG
jgi:signal peptidase II